MLETERLILRPYRLEDYAAYLAMVTDPEMDFPSRQPIAPEEAWHRLLRYAGHWALLGYGDFALIEKSSGEYVGETGLWDAHRGMGDDFDGYDEAGWFIVSRKHGIGYATEAVQAVHRWYWQTVQKSRTVCMIDPGNDRSLHLAKKLGYQPFREAIYEESAVVLLECNQP